MNNPTTALYDIRVESPHSTLEDFNVTADQAYLRVKGALVGDATKVTVTRTVETRAQED